MKGKMKGNLLLLLAAFIWGSTFVAQKSGMDLIGPLTFNGLRCLLGGLVLIPVALFIAKEDPIPDDASEEERKAYTKTLLLGGLCCGLVVFAASNLQQIGLLYTTAGKSGFITTLYVVFTPLCGIFLRKKIRPVTWLGVVMALFGLYLLCFKAGSPINMGDIITLLGSVGYTAHILVIDHFSPKVNGVKMSCLQFLVCGIISMPLAFIFEEIDWGNILNCWLPIAYAGVLSCGVAYTLQIIAQKNTEPVVASVLMSMESVFAVVCAALILGEMMSIKELIGCVIMFAALIIVQLPSKEERLAAKAN